MTGSRIASVDALRGLTVAAMLLVNNPGDWGAVYAPLQHAAWHGWTPTDLIFPLFLFIVGVSLALAIGARLESGRTEGLRAQLLTRGLRILLLGLVLHAIAWWLMDKAALRLPGVLQRIAICFTLTGLIVLAWRERGQWACIVALLAGYAALLLLGGGLDKADNIASRVDAWLLGAHAYEWDAASGRGHDPEGLLATLGALASTLIGWRCGEWLRHGAMSRLIGLGLLLSLLGALLHTTGLMPLNKNLWTPSFVLFCAGLSALALGAAHVLIDRRGWPAVGRSFGVNAIAAYAGAWLCAVVLEGMGWLTPLVTQGFGWLQPWIGAQGASLAYALAFVAVWALIVRELDRRALHIKI